jgi:hypothetical protein
VHPILVKQEAQVTSMYRGAFARQRALQGDFASDCTRRWTNDTRSDLGGIDLGSDFQAHTEGLFQLVFKEAAILLGLDQLLLKAMLWGKT